MSTIHAVLLCFVGFQKAYAQLGSGGFGGGFGCGAYLPTVGNECYVPETGKRTVTCRCKYNQLILLQWKVRKEDTK